MHALLVTAGLALVLAAASHALHGPAVLVPRFLLGNLAPGAFGGGVLVGVEGAVGARDVLLTGLVDIGRPTVLFGALVRAGALAVPGLG
ncbi:hypothetical protein GCM10010493_74390 [Streptomyces lavendulae subsp. grasserius]